MATVGVRGATNWVDILNALMWAGQVSDVTISCQFSNLKFKVIWIDRNSMQVAKGD